ncbi:substrate-binding periplasmic protein [Pseudoduganella aquatica]|uniref:Transporter substrate-binding domain-containing protein n=1 Tax=Pseudoduganella aquatica TaxID=2660641 RepID=A0A7X4HGK9_9BURK|nr:transporter substrate-binding domain-containing protein [Pseudoduganella aquatica]MYN10893.1 transporter substrate-binding domain-containing protein [Pseudoduganella aquatica]
MKRASSLWLTQALLLLPALAWSQAEPLQLQIVELPPYMVVSPDGAISGTVVDLTLAAFRKAGIAVVMEIVPASRQLAVLKQNAGPVCSVGWIKNPERASYAKFSDMVRQDAPWVVVAPANWRSPATATLQALLANSRINVLVKQSFFYGDYLEQKMATMRAKRQISTGNMGQLLKMIAAGRADLTFVPRDGFQYYVRNGRVEAGQLQVVDLPDMPPGFQRHLMCSKSVSDDVLKRFNAALSPPQPTSARLLPRSQ